VRGQTVKEDIILLAKLGYFNIYVRRMTINKQHNRSAWWDMGNKVISQPAIKEFCRNLTFFRLSKESSSNTTINLHQVGYTEISGRRKCA